MTNARRDPVRGLLAGLAALGIFTSGAVAVTAGGAPAPVQAQVAGDDRLGDADGWDGRRRFDAPDERRGQGGRGPGR